MPSDARMRSCAPASAARGAVEDGEEMPRREAGREGRHLRGRQEVQAQVPQQARRRRLVQLPRQRWKELTRARPRFRHRPLAHPRRPARPPAAAPAVIGSRRRRQPAPDATPSSSATKPATSPTPPGASCKDGDKATVEVRASSGADRLRLAVGPVAPRWSERWCQSIGEARSSATRCSRQATGSTGDRESSRTPPDVDMCRQCHLRLPVALCG